MNFEPALDFLGGTVVKTNAGNERDAGSIAFLVFFCLFSLCVS